MNFGFQMTPQLGFQGIRPQATNMTPMRPQRQPIKPIVDEEDQEVKMSVLFPGLNTQQVQHMAKITEQEPPQTRLQKQTEIYREILPQIESKKKMEDRTAQKNELFMQVQKEKDPERKQMMMATLRASDIADQVRTIAGPIQEADDEIIQKLVDETPNGYELFAEYLNTGNEEFLFESGLKEREEQLDENLLTDLGIGVGGTIGAIAGSYGIGKATENIGKGIYGLTLPPGIDEARAIQKNKAGLGPKPRTTVETAIDKNIMGTRSMIGTQAEKEANKIFTKTVNPMLEKSTSKTNVQGLIDELGKEIEKFAKGDPDKLAEYNDAMKEMKKSFRDKKFIELPQKELHELKSGLQGRTPQKFFKGKEITNAYQELRAKLATKLTKSLHSNLTKEFGEDTAKLYKDYSNLQGLKEVGVKSRSAAGFKGGFGGFWSTVAQELATPSTTIGGKSLVSVGKLLQKPAKITLKGIKAIAKAGKGVLSVDPTGILSSIIENEIYTKDLKGQQFPIRQQMVLGGMDKEEAAKKAKTFPPTGKSTDLVNYF